MGTTSFRRITYIQSIIQRFGNSLHCEDLPVELDEDMVDGALHLRRHLFAPVMSFLIESCWKLTVWIHICMQYALDYFYNILSIDDLEILSGLVFFSHTLTIISLHNRFHDWFGTNRTLSTRNIGLLEVTAVSVYRFRTLNTVLCHIQLFCRVAVAYSSSFQGNNYIPFSFGRHIAWSNVYKWTKQ